MRVREDYSSEKVSLMTVWKGGLGGEACSVRVCVCVCVHVCSSLEGNDEYTLLFTAPVSWYNPLLSFDEPTHTRTHSLFVSLCYFWHLAAHSGITLWRIFKHKVRVNADRWIRQVFKPLHVTWIDYIWTLQHHHLYVTELWINLIFCEVCSLAVL